MLFSTIVSDTRAVAIGPLEYCGNGKVIKMPHGKTVYVLPHFVLTSLQISDIHSRVSIVRHDPSIPQFYAQREMIGLERKSNGLDRSGATKKSMSDAQQLKRRKIKAKTSLLSNSSPAPSESSGTSTALAALTSSTNLPAVKRRRLSADKALVVSVVGVENVDVESISLGRRKQR